MSEAGLSPFSLKSFFASDHSLGPISPAFSPVTIFEDLPPWPKKNPFSVAVLSVLAKAYISSICFS